MQIVLAFVLVAFGASSTDAMMQVGYLGVLQAGTANVGAWQVLMDLVIMSTVAMVFMWRDVRRGDRSFWAFATITLAAGSFGSLRHLLLALVEGKPSELTS